MSEASRIHAEYEEHRKEAEGLAELEEEFKACARDNVHVRAALAAHYAGWSTCEQALKAAIVILCRESAAYQSVVRHSEREIARVLRYLETREETP